MYAVHTPLTPCIRNGQVLIRDIIRSGIAIHTPYAPHVRHPCVICNPVDTQHMQNSSAGDVPPNHLGDLAAYLLIFSYAVWASWHRRRVEQGHYNQGLTFNKNKLAQMWSLLVIRNQIAIQALDMSLINFNISIYVAMAMISSSNQNNKSNFQMTGIELHNHLIIPWHHSPAMQFETMINSLCHMALEILVLIPEMPCCLMVPSHCLNQCWLNINKIHWQAHEGFNRRYLSHQSSKLGSAYRVYPG